MNICFQKTHQRAFGTFPLKGDVLTAAVQAAAQVGYRAFDTAQMYGNEAVTGAALAAVRPLRQVRVYSPTPEKRQAFVASVAGKYAFGFITFNCEQGELYDHHRRRGLPRAVHAPGVGRYLWVGREGSNGDR